MSSTHRRGRPANTVPDARLPVPTVRLGSANDDGNATPRILLGSDGAPTNAGDGAGDGSGVSPSQIRLNAKKQLSPINGKQVCTLALVDALPRYVAPRSTLGSGSSPASNGLSCGGGGSALGSGASVSPRRSHDGGSPVKSPCRSRDCSICLMPLCGCSVVVMACLHSFHYDCAKEWLSQHDGSCPDCRTVVCIENFMFPSEMEGDAEVALRVHQEQQQEADTAEEVRNDGVQSSAATSSSNGLSDPSQQVTTTTQAAAVVVSVEFSVPPPMPRQLWEQTDGSVDDDDEAELATLVVATDSLAIARAQAGVLHPQPQLVVIEA